MSASRDLAPRDLAPRGEFALRFIQRVFLWLLPVALVWNLVTPFYNLFLTEATRNLFRLTESPDVTRLPMADRHHFLVERLDFPVVRATVSSVKVTDTHFPLILLGAFFLAVPGVGWKRRLEALGWALLLSVFFHLLSLYCHVKFIYATQLGEWSAENYGAFGQNFWGMAKHLLDLPFKFAWPLLLWAFFYVRLLWPRSAEER